MPVPLMAERKGMKTQFFTFHFYTECCIIVLNLMLYYAAKSFSFDFYLIFDFDSCPGSTAGASWCPPFVPAAGVGRNGILHVCPFQHEYIHRYGVGNGRRRSCFI